MTVIEKNSGTKIPYEVVKNKICFDDAGYVVVQTADGSSTYAAPASGDLTAGLHPATATSGGTSGGGLVAEESGLGVSYIAKVCGSAPGINF